MDSITTATSGRVKPFGFKPCTEYVYIKGLNKVNRRQNYHHGNLQATFLDQACKILEQDGLSNISVRKISETIGVSHTAFKNHFNNMTGLYTAMVTKGYADLAKMMKSKATDKSNRNDRRSAALLGYVEFASTYPALYELNIE